MSADAPQHEQDEVRGRQGAPGEPSEAELRAAYEAELDRITVTDMVAQAAVSLLNIAARRLAPPPPEAPAAAGPGATAAGGRDLEQVRDGIDAVSALLGILERRIPQEVRPLRDALSQLQLAYASEVRASAEGAPAGAPGEGAPGDGTDSKEGGEGAAADSEKPGPGPAQASGRLWVPGS